VKHVAPWTDGQTCDANKFVSPLSEVPKNGNEVTPEITAVFVTVCTSHLLSALGSVYIGASWIWTRHVIL
jgi:hypothetical protein